MSIDFEDTLRGALRREAELAPDVGDLAVRTRKERARQRVRGALLTGGGLVLVLAVAVPAVGWLRPGTSLAPAAVAPSVSSDIVLMTQDAPTDQWMTASLSGALVVTDAGCLGVQWQPTSEVQPVVWPYGWTAVRDGDGRAVLQDDRGRAVGREGDKIEIGGGLVGPNHKWQDNPCATREPFLGGPDVTIVN